MGSDFSLNTASVRILRYCCTRIRYITLAIFLSDSGEWMHRDKIPTQLMHAACCIVKRRPCCTKRFAEFNGNYCESYCSLGQLVASLCAAHEGKSATGTHHSKTEGQARRYFVQTSRFAVLWGVHLD